MGIFCMTQETQTGTLYQPRGVGWGERWEGGSEGGEICIPMADHVDVWQKPTKFCKVINLQLKKNKTSQNVPWGLSQ